MQTDRQSWLPSGRDIVANIIGNLAIPLAGAVAAAIITWWADPNTTRAGVVIYFAGLLLAFAVAWVLGAWGWRILFPTPKPDDTALRMAKGMADALKDYRHKQPASIVAVPALKPREWTAYEKDERARQIGEVLKFLDGEVEAALADAQQLVHSHSLPWRNRMRAPTYVKNRLANRDAARDILKTLQRLASSCYADIATLFDEHEFSRLVSAEENFHRSLINVLLLPPDTKPEIILDLLGPRVANFEVAVDELRRWHGAARRDLIALRESDR